MEKPKRFLNNDEINKSLMKLLEDSISEISNLRYSQALDSLRRCEGKLEVLVNQGISIDQDIILPTLNNIALCHQAMGNLQECSSYLEACIYNLKHKSDLHSNIILSLPEKIRKIRYLCLLNIQLSDCFSKLNQHQQASAIAKQATKQCNIAIRLCLNALNDTKISNHSSYNLTGKKKVNFEFYSNSSNILQHLHSQMKGRKPKKPSKEISMRSALGVQRFSDWIFTLSFEKITEIKPLVLTDLKAPHNLRAELSKDFMLDKICMCVASCYLVSKELNYLKEESLKAKTFLQRAISISTFFFPSSCPFLQNLVREYSEKYAKHAKGDKKIKTPPRSTSAKATKTVFQVQEIQEEAIKVTIPKKKHFEIKKIPWKIQSERNPNQNVDIVKGSHTKSESNMAKNIITSPPNFEKTEPEPPLSEESEEGEEDDIVKNFIISSSDLYGNYSEEEVDKYEYMPLRRDI